MKHFLLSTLLFTFSFLSFGQCPTTPITLSSQADVDNFTTNYPGCTEILNGFTISGADITDLTPLLGITSITNYLFIEDNSQLGNLDGLDNIINFNPLGEGVFPADIYIFNNSSLTDISALANMNINGNIEAISVKDNPLLNSLNGLQGITNWVIYYIFIHNNDSLIDLDGLNNITGVEEIEILDNDNINSLSGFDALQSVGTFTVINNDSLISFSALPYISPNCGIEIKDNELIEDIDAFSQFLNNCTIDLEIDNNPNLSICNSVFVCSFLDYYYGDTFGPQILISNNAEGCNSLAQVAQSCGLVPSNDECSGAIEIIVGETIEAYNDLATTSSETPSCNDVDRADVWFIFNSGSNSSVDIIIDSGYNIQLWEGNCGSLSQVSGSCTTGSLLDFAVTTDTTYYVQVWSCAGCRVESSATGLFTIYIQDGILSTNEVDVATVELFPNPVKNSLIINSTQTISNIEIYNFLGQQILITNPNTLTTEIDLTTLSQGMYLVKVKSLGSEQTFRVVKE